MPKFLPKSTPELNRLRAPATLIPIIESGLADSKLLQDKAALMASFCEWAAEATTSDTEEAMLSQSIGQGLDRLKARFARSV